MRIWIPDAKLVLGSLLMAVTLAACESLIYRQPSFGDSDVVRHAFQRSDGTYNQWLGLNARIDPGTATIGQVRVYYSTDPGRDPSTFPYLPATWNPATRSAGACIPFALIGIPPNGGAPNLVRHYWRAEYSAGGATDVLHRELQTVTFQQFAPSPLPCG